MLVEGTLGQRVLAGIQGPHLSEGNRHLPPGYQGQKCCLDIPQTQRTQGWWCPRSQNHFGVRVDFVFKFYNKKTKHLLTVNKMIKTITKAKPCPPGGGVARRPPMDAGTMLSKE